jgi:hypothetical protein
MGEVEVSFADFQNNKNVQKMSGFSKIRGCCAHASPDGWEYVWIDFCSIDKSSSAELLEAINSMFLWYTKTCTKWTRHERQKMSRTIMLYRTNLMASRREASRATTEFHHGSQLARRNHKTHRKHPTRKRNAWKITAFYTISNT